MKELQHKFAETAAALEDEADSQNDSGESREELNARKVVLEDEIKVSLLIPACSLEEAMLIQLLGLEDRTRILCRRRPNRAGKEEKGSQEVATRGRDRDGRYSNDGGVVQEPGSGARDADADGVQLRG